MFSYYIKLALVSMRKTPGLVALMVLAIGLGIGAAMTTVTVNYLMGTNPIPHKGDDLFAIQLDSWDPNEPHSEPNLPPDQVTYTDAINLIDSAPAFRQTAQSRTAQVIELTGEQGKELKPYLATARTNYADFFPMFDVPFLYGKGWTKQEDLNSAFVAVLSKQTNEKLFGGENSVGKTFLFGAKVMQVVGILDTWAPLPKFYDLTTGAFDEPEALYIPFTTQVSNEWGRSGNTNCWKPVDGEGYQGFIQSECVWIQFWAELPNEEAKQDYKSFIDNYAREQKKLGRFPRPLNNRLNSVPQWLEVQKVVTNDAQILMWLSALFLLVCLLNTIGLMLAKFIGKSGEIGLRRAVGASKQSIFNQHLMEATCVGLLGGLFGLFLTWLGLQGIQSLYSNLNNALMQLDIKMALSAVLLAILATVLAGLYPTIMASKVLPATQLKSQ
ncbi:ABC transporter permease [Pseudoalteromonas denitrificans]|uniref:Putative ABC transport system permease protein n=1 Tax=Pseudoalteromonas denitrificans DSM 6059 TaxID=1123010 RepID=A0A1I1M1H4_9GAMM|nr:ABC transporter permease [Pseudoalteromonas denitrificans]SFC79065.1 putative ABC transport system permease protein [Pseudoalteromonas denitrificans DSM 6059]